MEELIKLEISDDSSTPKYKQIVHSIIGKIETEKIKYGQKLPSINQLSFDYFLSRDTVEKAYIELRKKGIIESVKGKGYYVRNARPESRLKVLVLFNKLSSYKKVIYNTMAHLLGEKAHIDFFIYHCNYDLFERIISEHLQGYNYYVIMPHFIGDKTFAFKHLLEQIPQEKVILLDHHMEEVDHFHGLVYQDFKIDIYNALCEAHELIKKYEELVLVFPENQHYPYPKDIMTGFMRFCSFHQIDFKVIHEITPQTPIGNRIAYVVIEENDLVHLIKRARQEGLQLGKDLGVLSYNDTPLKEVLEDGITVITTDFVKMGSLAAEIILASKPIQCKNDFQLIVRNSL